MNHVSEVGGWGLLESPSKGRGREKGQKVGQ